MNLIVETPLKASNTFTVSPAQQAQEDDRHCPALHAQPRKKFLLFDPHAHALLQKNLFFTQLHVFSLHGSMWSHGIKAG